jgi:hypothetical protein
MSTTGGVSDAKGTLEMRVANTGFIVDRLGRDCHPLQFLRELTHNSIQAIEATPTGEGEVVWDFDEAYVHLEGVPKLCCIDNGVGMTGEEMVMYINMLSASTHDQTHHGNFGVGAKVAAATRNHVGLLYLSWKDGQGWMTHLWRDPDSGQYGLRRREREDGDYADYWRISDDIKPPQIKDNGTMVVLLGNEDGEDTTKAPKEAAAPSWWVGKYLNTRYYRFPEGINVKVREHREGQEGWLMTVTGQGPYLEEHAQASDALRLDGANAHWWILKDEPALAGNAARVASRGHMATLYQDELYEMVTGTAGVARLQQFGVIFGHNRVVVYIEPDASPDLGSNTARTQLLIAGETLPWAEWAAEFRDAMPEEIEALMAEVAAGTGSTDHSKSIRERLKPYRDLFRVSRYRRVKDGSLTIAQDTEGGRPREKDPTEKQQRKSGGGGMGGRAGGVYALFAAESGNPGEEVRADPDPKVYWITVANGTRSRDQLEDRAAKYLATQNVLQINADFRIFTDMIDRWAERYSHVAGSRDTIVQVVREWFEQALIETVLGAQALQGSSQWPLSDVAKLWDEESLTAAVLQRYHIDVNVKRTLGMKLGTLRVEKVAA